MVWFLVLIAIALALVLQLDPATIRMSVIGAALAVSYPFFKRFFPLPQFYLGVAFSWGVPMVFMAQNGRDSARGVDHLLRRHHLGGHLRHDVRHGRSRRRSQDRREIQRHRVRRHGQA